MHPLLRRKQVRSRRRWKWRGLRVLVLTVVLLGNVPHESWTPDDSRRSHAVTGVFAVARLTVPQVPVRTARVLSDVSGIGNVPFGRLANVALGPGGTAYTVDILSAELHHIAKGGARIQTVGGQGDGPGELIRPCCPRLFADSILWVVGLRGRVERFSTRGGKLRYVSRLTPRGGSYFFLSAQGIGFLPGRRIQLVATKIPRRGTFATVLLQVDESGFVVKEHYPVVSAADSAGRVTFRQRDGQLVSMREIPYGPRSLLRQAKDGSYLQVVTSEYRVRHYDPGGSLRREIRARASATPLTAAERDTVERFAAAMRRVERETGSRIVSLREPRIRPVIADAWFDDDNRLWVQTDTAGANVRVADVYSDKGFLLFRTRWPADIDLASGALTGFSGWGIRRNDMDETSLVEVVFQ